MVRTARRRREDKLQPLPATPWGELVGGKGSKNERESDTCPAGLLVRRMPATERQPYALLVRLGSGPPSRGPRSQASTMPYCVSLCPNNERSEVYEVNYITAFLSIVTRPPRSEEAQGYWRCKRGGDEG